jgi:hypothetical protein
LVERHLVAPLAEMVFPLVMARYTDKEIQYLAAEAIETIQMREESKMKNATRSSVLRLHACRI